MNYIICSARIREASVIFFFLWATIYGDFFLSISLSFFAAQIELGQSQQSLLLPFFPFFSFHELPLPLQCLYNWAKWAKKHLVCFEYFFVLDISFPISLSYSLLVSLSAPRPEVEHCCSKSRVIKTDKTQRQKNILWKLMKMRPCYRLFPMRKRKEKKQQPLIRRL